MYKIFYITVIKKNLNESETNKNTEGISLTATFPFQANLSYFCVIIMIKQLIVYNVLLRAYNLLDSIRATKNSSVKVRAAWRKAQIHRADDISTPEVCTSFRFGCNSSMKGNLARCSPTMRRKTYNGKEGQGETGGNERGRVEGRSSDRILRSACKPISISSEIRLSEFLAVRARLSDRAVRSWLGLLAPCLPSRRDSKIHLNIRCIMLRIHGRYQINALFFSIACLGFHALCFISPRYSLRS